MSAWVTLSLPDCHSCGRSTGSYFQSNQFAEPLLGSVIDDIEEQTTKKVALNFRLK